MTTLFSVAEAQAPTRLWVDFFKGDDTNGTGAANNPWKTVTHAIAQASPGTGHVVIMLKPAVYDDAIPVPGMGEIFPLQMKANVSLQGTSALDTVIRSKQGTRVLIDFRATAPGAFDDVFIDAININNEFFANDTLQTGILITNDDEHRFPANPTISNCFITDHADAGIDIVSAPNGDPAYDLGGAFSGFIPHRPRIVNCTFRLNNIGLRNTMSVPVGGQFFGANQPGLVNCLLVDQYERGTSLLPGDDLQGIDWDDLNVDISGVGVNSNAFERHDTLAGAPLLWSSTPTPTSAVNVGAMRSSLLSSTGTPWLFVHDYVRNMNNQESDLRLNPALCNALPTVIDAGLDPGSAWTWKNLTTGSRLLASQGDSFDFDCEGYGNARLVDYLGGGSGPLVPDIGADEVGELVIGGYNGARFGKIFIGSPQTVAYYWFSPLSPWSAIVMGKQFTSSMANLLYFGVLLNNVPNVRALGTSLPVALGAPFFGVSYVGSSPPTYTPTPFNFPHTRPPFQTQGTYSEQAALDGLPGSGQYLVTNLQTYTVF